MKIVAKPIKYVDDWGVGQTLHFVFVNDSYEIWKADIEGNIIKLFKNPNMALATLHWKKYNVALGKISDRTIYEIEIM